MKMTENVERPSGAEAQSAEAEQEAVEKELDQEIKEEKKKKKVYPSDSIKYPKLSAGRRRKIIEDDARGIKDPNYEVIITKKGTPMVRKRKVPLATNSIQNTGAPDQITASFHEPTKEERDKLDSMLNVEHSKPKPPPEWMNGIQYFNVQNTLNSQLAAQIDELKKELSHQNDKRKKLKEKYRKLKKSLYEDDEVTIPPDDEGQPEPEAEPQPEPEGQPQPEGQPEPEPQSFAFPQRRRVNTGIDYSRWFN